MLSVFAYPVIHRLQKVDGSDPVSYTHLTETWNLLKKELLESISKTEDSQNREILEHIYAYAIQKDKTGIVQYIKKHSYTIEKDILVGITCSALYEFIKWCLGIYM